MSSRPHQDESLTVLLTGVSKAFASRLTARRLLGCLLPWSRKPAPDDFWALRDVSIQLRRGEAIGLIGRNGSGKSTLLQIIAGLTEPTEGTVHISGRTSALLELGAGFNPEFTGRENIFLSGAIYGFDREMMRERLDRIVSFADIGKHLDQPVKTYSSGMFARLAFAVAIQIDPDIILVDEILSVGDVAFQSKCFQQIQELRDNGSSIILVSHDMNSVQMFCDRAYLLHRGQLLLEGTPREATDRYLHVLMEERDGLNVSDKWSPIPNDLCKAMITDISIRDSAGKVVLKPIIGRRYVVAYTVQFRKAVPHPIVTAQLKTIMGIVVSDMTSLSHGVRLPACGPGDRLRVQFDFRLNVCPGPYRVGVSIAESVQGTSVPVFGTERMTIEAIADGPTKGHGIVFTDSALTIDHSGGKRMGTGSNRDITTGETP